MDFPSWHIFLCHPPSEARDTPTSLQPNIASPPGMSSVLCTLSESFRGSFPCSAPRDTCDLPQAMPCEQASHFCSILLPASEFVDSICVLDIPINTRIRQTLPLCARSRPPPTPSYPNALVPPRNILSQESSSSEDVPNAISLNHSAMILINSMEEFSRVTSRPCTSWRRCPGWITKMNVEDADKTKARC